MMVKRTLLVGLVLAAALVGCKSIGTDLDDPVKPDSGEVASAEAWRTTQPTPGPSPAIVPPKFNESSIRTGLTVLTAERDNLPLVSVVLALRVGSSADPRGKEGLADLAYAMLLEGAGNLDSLEYAEAFADLGAAPSVDVGADGATISFTVLERNLDAALDLLAKAIRKPKLDKVDFERRKKESLASLASAVGDPGWLANVAFAEEIYGKAHPYGHPSGGLPDSVQRIELKDVKGFLKKHLGPKNAALVFAGQISPAKAKSMTKKHLQRWKTRTKKARAIKAVKAAPRKEIVVVPKADLAQTVILVGRPAIALGDDGEWPLRVASKAFGGVFGSRLNMNLREDKGYTYGARSRVSARRDAGILVASSQVDSQYTGASLKEFMAEIAGSVERPFSEGEMVAARDSIVQSLPGRFQSVGGLAGSAAGLFETGLGLDRYQQMLDACGALSLADINGAAKKWFDPDVFQIVLVGDRKLIEEQVGPLGLGEFRFVDPPEAPKL